jgi:hypothetical protein
VGDCVEVLMEGEPQPSQHHHHHKKAAAGPTGMFGSSLKYVWHQQLTLTPLYAHKITESRAYGEIVWLFRRRIAGSTASQDDENDEENEEEEEEGTTEVVAEIRWFYTPAELLPKPEDRA